MDIREIFEAIKNLEPFSRQKIVEERIGDDPQLRQELERLLDEFDARTLIPEMQSNGKSEGTLLFPALEQSRPEKEIGREDSSTTLLAGRYKLIAPIGEGGMGSVWLAEQKEPVKRRVAIKLVKAGMDSAQVLARFEAERQALAMMDHPNIARVFDGGLTPERRPFFAMELVKGIPITEYSDRNGLSVRERLEIFTQVCDAIQHAHQKGIIHRDLKPSNILVAETDGKGIVKVIDFGLAKALHGTHTLTDLTMNTAQGVVVGTPLYMAPEQIYSNSLDIDTRVDVYSLGVILYELLTGTTPIDRDRVKKAAWDEFRKMVAEEEPIRPSSRISTSESLKEIAKARHAESSKLVSLVRGELDWIILKSLEKERRRRYESASEFNADIHRYLRGDAIQAAPPSKIYQIRKFVSRHRIAVSVSGLVIATLVAGIVGTSYGLVLANESAKKERKAREVAQANRKEAISAVRQFGEVITNNEQLKQHEDLSELRKSLLTSPLKFFQKLKTELTNEGEDTDEVLTELGDAAVLIAKLTAELGNQQETISLYNEAIEILERLLKNSPSSFETFEKLIDCEFELANAYGDIGEADKAMGFYKKGLDRLQTSSFDQPSELDTQSFERARALLGIANEYVKQTKDELANEHFRLALEELNKSKDRFQYDVKRENLRIDLMERNASLALDQRKYSEAKKLLTEAIQVGESLKASGRADLTTQRLLGDCHETISYVLADTGEVGPAYDEIVKAAAIFKKIYLDNPSSVENALNYSAVTHNTGDILFQQGTFGAALEKYEEAKKINEQLLAEKSQDERVTTFLRNNRGQIALVKALSGRYEETIQEYQAISKIDEANAKNINDHTTNAATRNNLAMFQIRQGQFEDALQNVRMAIMYERKVLESRSTDNIGFIQMVKHGIVLVEIGNALRSKPVVAEGLALLREFSAVDSNVDRVNKAIQAGETLSGYSVDELVNTANSALVCKAYATAADIYEELGRRDESANAKRPNWLVLAKTNVAAGTDQTVEREVSQEDARVYRDRGRRTVEDSLNSLKQESFSSANSKNRVILNTLDQLEKDPLMESVRSPFFLQQMEQVERECWEKLWREVATFRESLEMSNEEKVKAMDACIIPLQNFQKSGALTDEQAVDLGNFLYAKAIFQTDLLQYFEAIQNYHKSIEIRRAIRSQSPQQLKERVDTLLQQILYAELLFCVGRIDEAYQLLENGEAELLELEKASDEGSLFWQHARLLLLRSNFDADQGRFASARAQLDLAEKYCEQAFEINLLDTNVSYYREVLKEYLDLAGRRRDAALEEVGRKKLAEFTKRLPEYKLAILQIEDVLVRGWNYPTKTLLRLAHICLDTGEYVKAAKLFKAGLEPSRFDSIRFRKGSLIDGASAFVLAAEILDRESTEANHEEAKKLRMAALDLLEEAIDLSFEKGDFRFFPIHEFPARWERNPDFKSVREQSFLDKLEQSERDQWTSFWAKVSAKKEALRQKILTNPSDQDKSLSESPAKE